MPDKQADLRVVDVGFLTHANIGTVPADASPYHVSSRMMLADALYSS